MQKLHLVGFTTDHRALILSPRRGARSGGFVLEVDESVADAVAAALEQVEADAAEAEEAAAGSPDADERRQESSLSVREVQARLRAGQTIEQVAAEAGVEPAWVERFAPPVVAEQERVVAAAQETTFVRAKLGPSTLPLGAAVRRNLTSRASAVRAQDIDAGWSARQLPDGRWLVSLEYTSRGKRRRPAWLFDRREGTLEAEDRLAAQLAHVPGEARPTGGNKGGGRRRAGGSAPAKRAGSRAGGTSRVAAARKEAEERLDAAVRQAASRNAEIARRASSVWAAAPARPSPAPAPAPAPERPSGTAKPASPPASRGRGPSADSTPGAGRDPFDTFAATLAAVRRDIEDELSAFERRRTGRPARKEAPGSPPAGDEAARSAPVHGRARAGIDAPPSEIEPASVPAGEAASPDADSVGERAVRAPAGEAVPPEVEEAAPAPADQGSREVAGTGAGAKRASAGEPASDGVVAGERSEPAQPDERARGVEGAVPASAGDVVAPEVAADAGEEAVPARPDPGPPGAEGIGEEAVSASAGGAAAPETAESGGERAVPASDAEAVAPEVSEGAGEEAPAGEALAPKAAEGAREEAAPAPTGGAAAPEVAEEPAVSPAADEADEEATAARRSRWRRGERVVRTPIDLSSLTEESGLPVFRGDVSPAGAGTSTNGATHGPAAAPGPATNGSAATPPSDEARPDTEPAERAEPAEPAEPAAAPRRPRRRPPRTEPLRAR